MRKIISKKKIVIIIVVLLIAALYFGIKGCGSNVNMEYDYIKLDRGGVDKTISASGQLDLTDAYIVKSFISGEIAAYYADFNDYVKRGELLAVINAPILDNEIKSFMLTYKRAKMGLDSQREFMESKEELFKEQLISPKALEDAKRSYDGALSQFKQTQMTYEGYMEQERNKRVYAPVAGTIIQRWAEVRTPVAPGAQLYLIAPNLEKLKLIINIDESDIGLVRDGQQVQFTVSAYPERTFYGKIVQVRMNPIPKGGIVTYESLVTCDNSAKLLRPGMSVTAIVNIDKKNGVMRVPNQAFIVNPDEKAVFEEGKRYIWRKKIGTISSDKFERVEVVTGLVGDNYTEIVSGKLQVGDEILVSVRKKLESKDELASYGK